MKGLLIVFSLLLAAPSFATAEESAPEPATAPAPIVHFETSAQNYEVRLVGEGEDVVLKVAPLGEFKVNMKYPWKLKSETQTFTKDQFELSEEQALIRADKAQTLSGELRFSVCSQTVCEVEKLTISPE